MSAQVWRAQVGRVPLYLLDTDVDGNPDGRARSPTQLYGGDREPRIRQELVLGVGGVRALRGLGLDPTVFHMNEGHSAFLQLERLRELVEDGGPPRDAALHVCGRRPSSRPTRRSLPETRSSMPHSSSATSARSPSAAATRGTSSSALGRVQDEDSRFGLTPFALRTSSYANGVSALHGEVSREMWRNLWPDRAADDVPIGSVTNGVHARTWIDEGLDALLGSEEDMGTTRLRARVPTRRGRTLECASRGEARVRCA